MPSAVTPQRRAKDSVSEHQIDIDSADSSSDGTYSRSSKKARLNLNGDTSSSQRSLFPHGQLSQIDAHHGRNIAKPRTNALEFQPGSIVRVKLANFVTYTAVEFFPGSSLNMVIGPNGTGKSTLVCAICLGMGWGAKHLGRAKEVSEFVKHGCHEATIEIELQGRPQQRNPVLRCVIKRDGNPSSFYINDKPSPRKEVMDLAKSFAIQIDNLCQFLPQDKVVEFAAMTPVELLSSTQRAVAPQEMLDWHQELKVLRSNQHDLQAQNLQDLETLANLESRQRMQEADVERMREREAIKQNLEKLVLAGPIVQFRETRSKHNEMKKRRIEAQSSLEELRKEVEPSLRAVNAKQQYRDQMKQLVAERKRLIETTDKRADVYAKKVNSFQDRFQEIEAEKENEKKGSKANLSEVRRLDQVITGLKKQLEQQPIEFDVSTYNENIRAKEREVRECRGKGGELQQNRSDLDRQGVERNQRIERGRKDLENLESQAGRQYEKLVTENADTAKAWDWIQEHQGEFEKHVYGPPMLECSVKDPKYMDLVEATLGGTDFTAFTVQTSNDMSKLHQQLYNVLKLGRITIRTVLGTLENFPPPVSREQLRHYGLEGWVLDHVTGPDAILAMLCESSNLHRTGIAIQDTTPQQFEVLQNSPIPRWVTRKNFYRINRRREYGASAFSTSVSEVRPARVWTDQPVDTTAKRDLQMKVDDWTEETRSIRAQIEEIGRQLSGLKNKVADLEDEKRVLQEEKEAKQKAVNAFRAIPIRIAQHEEKLNSHNKLLATVRDRLQALDDKQDDLTLEKAQAALAYASAVETLQKAHDGMYEAELMLIEATSDFEVLSERESEVKQQLETRQREVDKIIVATTQLNTQARTLMAECQKINEGLDDATREYLSELAARMTPEDLQNEMESEKARLDLMHEGNGGVIREYEERQKKIDLLKNRLQSIEAALKEFDANIKTVRDKWEPRLDKLVKRISASFAFNMKQISCAGEVSVHKDEEYDQWAIQIQVKFRENEPLTVLDSHRQSGGERAVSTIFYLMSLQSLTRSPFRVVDEINQGMDPRNERLVHARMVSIATGNDEQQYHAEDEDDDTDHEDNSSRHRSMGGGSQYFLITPKLLHGLRYKRGMRVLCIASGEYMPEDHTRVDFRGCLESKRKMMVTAR
ncbi:Structural maintenance of chromosomes protein 5 [Xylographa opegraphella]|nr:Structural maintenance of chromosomes protein 5 [Xylographa opegraphella]